MRSYEIGNIVVTLLLIFISSIAYAENIHVNSAEDVQPGQNKSYYIEVSISKCKLTLFEKTTSKSIVPIREFRVGTAAWGLEVVPQGKGVVTRIDFNPYWFPTQYTREIYAQKGIKLPAAVPPGDKLNYMGTFKISLSHKTSRGRVYRIHGNNNSKRVGKRVTGGCVCMDNKEGEELAKMITVGTEVNVVM